jgi:hypothetical protein
LRATTAGSLGDYGDPGGSPNDDYEFNSYDDGAGRLKESADIDGLRDSVDGKESVLSTQAPLTEVTFVVDGLDYDVSLPTEEEHTALAALVRGVVRNRSTDIDQPGGGSRIRLWAKPTFARGSVIMTLTVAASDQNAWCSFSSRGVALEECY